MSKKGYSMAISKTLSLILIIIAIAFLIISIAKFDVLDYVKNILPVGFFNSSQEEQNNNGEGSSEKCELDIGRINQNKEIWLLDTSKPGEFFEGTGIFTDGKTLFSESEKELGVFVTNKVVINTEYLFESPEFKELNQGEEEIRLADLRRVHAGAFIAGRICSTQKQIDTNNNFVAPIGKVCMLDKLVEQSNKNLGIITECNRNIQYLFNGIYVDTKLIVDEGKIYLGTKNTLVGVVISNSKIGISNEDIDRKWDTDVLDLYEIPHNIHDILVKLDGARIVGDWIYEIN